VGVHICIVSPYDPRPAGDDDPRALRGGVEEALDRVATGLAARGHDVTLVSSAARDGDEAVDGVRHVRVRRRGTLFRAPLAPLHRAIPPGADVVHVPATYPTVSDWIPLREAMGPRRRATVLDHHFDVAGTSAPMRAAAALHLATLGRAMRAATVTVAKSRDYAAHSRALRRVPRERLDVVPNGVDAREFPLGAHRGEGILCVGRLVPYKGVDVLLRAMPRVHRETGATLMVVGDGPERARLEALARELGAPVVFAGRVPRAELARRYGEARVTVLPSVNRQEAFGIALLESMATGTPVVASELPGVREVATTAGLTAPPGDADALAACVIDAWRAPRQFGTPAQIRARVVERYDWRAVVDGFERVYERACRGVEASA
jgi:glycosyltransferase involved in cell wall biosynthesis